MTDGEAPTGASEGRDLFSGAPAGGSVGGYGSSSTESGPATATGPELRRNDDRRALAGVCAGLGEYTRVDPVVWRTAFVLTAFAGGVGLLLYIAAWMLMRDPQGGPATFEQMLNRSIPPYAVLKLLTVGLGGATAFSLVGGFGWGTLLLAVPLVLGLLTARNRGVDLRASLLALRSDLAAHEPPPTGPVPQPVPAYYNPAQPWASAPQGPVDLAVVSERTSLGADDDEDDEGAEEEEDHGGHRDEYGYGHDHRRDHGDAPGKRKPRRTPLASHALWTVVVMAVVWAVTAPRMGAPFSEVSTTALLFGPELGVYFMAAVVGAVGLYSLFGTWVGNPRGLLFLGSLAVLGAVLVASTDVTKVRIGEERWAPDSAVAAGSEEMWLNAGSGRLDLTELAAELEPGQSVDVTARVDFGNLVLVVPEDARVNLVSEIAAGSVEKPDTGEDGRFGLSQTYEETFEPMGPQEPAEGTEDAENSEGREEADGNGETEEPAEGADDGTGRDGVPVINVHTSTKAGTVEVQYGQARN